MSNDFSAINSLMSSVLLVTDRIFNKAQFSEIICLRYEFPLGYEITLIMNDAMLDTIHGKNISIYRKVNVHGFNSECYRYMAYKFKCL